jgi:hypothetical protein
MFVDERIPSFDTILKTGSAFALMLAGSVRSDAVVCCTHLER